MVAKYIVVLLVVAVVGGFLAFLLVDGRDAPKNEGDADVTIIIPKGASTPPNDWSGGIVFDSRYYDPPIVRVVIGVNNTVKWVNMDDVSHTSTSLNVPSGSTGFDSGLIAPGSSFITKLNVEGRYAYFCSVHPWAGGIINADK